MKNYQLPFLLFAALASFSSTAQLRLSPEGGFNLCSIQAKGMYDDARIKELSNRIAYRIGIASDLKIARHFYIQPGLFYAKKGQALYGQDLFDQRSLFRNLENIDYLEVPIRIEYKSNKYGADRFIMGIGAYAAYALGGRTTLKTQEWGITEIHTLVIGNGKEDDIKPFDFGLSGNIGYEFACGLFIRSYYNYGLSNIGSGAYRWHYYTTETGISTGYWLPLKHKSVASSK